MKKNNLGRPATGQTKFPFNHRISKEASDRFDEIYRNLGLSKAQVLEKIILSSDITTDDKMQKHNK